MKPSDVFPCAECGKPVVLKAEPGRKREYAPGYMLTIPSDFEIPTCSSCGETYMTGEVATRLNALLRKKYLEMQAAHYRKLVDLLVQAHCVSQKDIVRACQVTPSYLSHVIAGKRQASATLTRLLEAFVACPSEFQRHLEGRQWSLPQDLDADEEASLWAPVISLSEYRRQRWAPAEASETPPVSDTSEVGVA